MQTVVSELIKGIISMASPSPGAGLTEGLQNGPASNRFARELAHRNSVSKLVDYILADFGPNPEEAISTTEDASMIEDPSASPTLPNSQSSASSVVHSISIIIELIRKNNADYFEPYLFHTLRNRLIQVQQHLQTHTEDGRETLERAMKEMVDRMGVVHLGSVLEIMCERLVTFQKYLRQPRSMVRVSCSSRQVLNTHSMTSKGQFRLQLVLSLRLPLNAIEYANFTQSFFTARIWRF
jgi:serine/threonine-protein phosphatase 6 regulatory subunit 3